MLYRDRIANRYLKRSRPVRVAIFSTTRAEAGILTPLIRALEEDPQTQPLVFLGGTHLRKQRYGADEFRVSGTFDYLLEGDDPGSLTRSVAKATEQLSSIFQNQKFDFVCVVGDRFELLAIITNAILFKKPIIHIHGGERTEGVLDEQIRHMITKAAHLHFVACEEYGKNVRMMGEPAWRIHNTGALGICNITRRPKARRPLFEDLGLDAGRETILLTYHPVTLESRITTIEQIENIFCALDRYDFQVVITAPNIEVDRTVIVTRIEQETRNKSHYHYVESLGTEKYLGLIPYCKFVIGNSSSGLLEVPYFRIPTINIGDRQKGRIRHRSVIDTDYSAESIGNAIEQALSTEFRASIDDMPFLFGDGSAAAKMVSIIKKTKIDQGFLRKRLDFPTRDALERLSNPAKSQKTGDKYQMPTSPLNG